MCAAELWICEGAKRGVFFCHCGGGSILGRAYMPVLTKVWGMCMHQGKWGVGGDTDPSEGYIYPRVIGAGGFSWDRGVGVVEMVGKNWTWFQFSQRPGANRQPKLGVLFKASWSGFITCRTSI